MRKLILFIMILFCVSLIYARPVPERHSTQCSGYVFMDNFSVDRAAQNGELPACPIGTTVYTIDESDWTTNNGYLYHTISDSARLEYIDAVFDHVGDTWTLELNFLPLTDIDQNMIFGFFEAGWPFLVRFNKASNEIEYVINAAAPVTICNNCWGFGSEENWTIWMTFFNTTTALNITLQNNSNTPLTVIDLPVTNFDNEFLATYINSPTNKQQNVTYWMIYNGTPKQEAIPDPPVISDLYDVTGAGTNETSDPTPTINLTTDIAATCNGSTDNATWFGFTTTGDIKHQWTVDASDPLVIGYPQNVTVNCTNEGGSTYATIVYNITDAVAPTIVLDKPDDNKEFVIDINNTFVLNFTATDNHFTTLDCNLTINSVLNQTNVSVDNGTLTVWNSTQYNVGSYQWNVSCTDGQGNENSSQRSFSVLADSCVMSDINIYLDGLNQSRKYEFGTTANLTANGTGLYKFAGTPCSGTICIDVDAPNAGVNVSCGTDTTSYSYNITTLRQDEFVEVDSGCYQEFANISNDCGGLDTGNYSFSNLYNDGNYLTAITTKGIFSVNYTKLSGSTAESIWRVRNNFTDSFGTTTQFTHDLSLAVCWSAHSDKVELRTNLTACPSARERLQYECYNGTDWSLLQTHGICGAFGSARLHEEAMVWDKSAALLNISMDNRTDLLSGFLNITGTDFPEGITITNEDVIIASLPGYLNGTNLTQKSFIYGGVKYNSTNITYTSAKTETIFINLSASGDGRFYNTTLQLFGFDIDAGNDVDYTQHFNDSDDITSDVNISTADNVEVIGEYDNYESNITDRWTVTNTNLNQLYKTGGLGDNYYYLFGDIINGIGISLDGSIINDGDSEFDLANYSRIDIERGVSTTCTGGGQAGTGSTRSKLIATDGTNEVIMHERVTTISNCFYCGPIATFIFDDNISLQRKSDTEYYVIVNDILDSTRDLSSLDSTEHWYLKFRQQVDAGTIAACSISGEQKIFRIQGSGLWNDKDAVGTEFTGNGSVCMDLIANTSGSTPYSAVTVKGAEYKPAGTDIKYTVSADNLLSRQLTLNNLRTVFTAPGSNLTGCVNLSGTNESSPIVYNLQWLVVPSAITDIEIDAGNDGTIDFNQSGVLNSTTSPFNVTIAGSAAGEYATDFASNQDFLFPLSISTGSEGLLLVTNLESKQDPNPVRLNVTSLEDCETCNIGATFLKGVLNFTVFALDFLGSINYTALAHTPDYSINASHLIEVKYSKQNCTFPQEVDYYEPFPIMSRDDKNVTPYGQEINYRNTSVDYFWEPASIPIYNCTYLGYDEDLANFTISMNDTVAGIDVWFDDDINKTGALNITTIAQHIMQLSKEASQGLWSWADFYNASLQSIYLFDPNITIEAYCSECLHNG